MFGICGLGLLLRRLNWLTEEADHSLLRVNINALLPCLILDSALGNPALRNISNLLLAPVLGFATLAAGIGLAWLASPLHGLTDRREARTFAATTGIFNYSYLAVPLMTLLFGERSVGLLFVFNVGVETGLWTLGVLTLSGGRLGQGWKRIFNGPLVAVVLVFLLNGTGLGGAVPRPVLTMLHWLGQCAIPLFLILVGAVAADHVGEFLRNPGWRVIGAAVVIRLGLLPCLFLALARYLPMTEELRRVVVVQSAMPAAMLPIVMAKHYGGESSIAVRVVLGTSLVALVTIPLWLRLGMLLVGK